jgi:type IV secretory pathway TraG/TraD family ATPase VirD4
MATATSGDPLNGALCMNGEWATTARSEASVKKGQGGVHDSRQLMRMLQSACSDGLRAELEQIVRTQAARSGMGVGVVIPNLLVWPNSGSVLAPQRDEPEVNST